MLDSEAELAADILRDLARGLFPSLLADKGLLAALSALVRKTTPTAVVEATPAATARWPPHVEAAAYFCCQEALDNAAHHAAGAPVTVHLDARSGWLEFSVTDSGPGFDPAAVDGTGLQHMTDRVEALAGTLRVSSVPTLGTQVSGRIPLQATITDANQPAVAVSYTAADRASPQGDHER